MSARPRQAPWTDTDGGVHYPRLEQHMVGGGRYASQAKPWEDTVTRWYFAYESYRGFKWVRMWHEKRLVHKLRPIYNYRVQPSQPAPSADQARPEDAAGRA